MTKAMKNDEPKFKTMSCEICGRSPREGFSVFRQNAKGQPGIWRCGEHNATEVDEVVDLLVEAIEERNEKLRKRRKR